jgi:predicted MFS family arabinose efflux permease
VSRSPLRGSRQGFLPASATSDSALLVDTRGLRALGDGLVSTVLAAYLLSIGLSGGQIGAIVTATLLGSATLTLLVGLRGHVVPRRRLLLAASALMFATGLVFAFSTTFVVLLVAAFVGTINPSNGDVSVFLPTEQALLPATVTAVDRTSMFARFSFVAFVAAAVGALGANLVPGRGAFLVYAGIAVCVFILYLRLSASIEPAPSEPAGPLGPSRRLVLKLAAVFSLDSLGGGFVVQSLLALWLYRRFDLSVGATGVIFFATGLLSGFSGLLAAPVARRIGLIRTMVFSHIPANLLLIATALMPTLPLAIACLLARSLLSQMDVPARSSYVMAVVTPPERAAAASVTNVPRSLAAALPPLAAGWMLDRTSFGWPLVIGGSLKVAYDLLLYFQFRHTRPPEELVT